MQVLNDALASAAISQQQAVVAQKALDDAEKAQALATQQAGFAKTLSDALAAAAVAGNASQQQAVAAQAAADAAAQSTALAVQATAHAAAQAQAVANAVSAQAASDATKQQSAVAAQAAADASAQQAAVAAQAAQDATAQATAVAAAIAAQRSSDRAKWLPTFYSQSSMSMPVAIAGYNFQVDMSLSTMNYSHVWMQAFTGFDQAGYGTITASSVSTLAAAQVTGTGIVEYYGGPYYGFSNVTLWSPQTASRGWYSGWLVNGSATQLVGWLINVGTSSAALWTLVVTPYGVTSMSPVARYSLNGTSTYMLTTSKVQSEVLSKMAVGNGINTLGFIYDASIGDYGQVTWISQI